MQIKPATTLLQIKQRNRNIGHHYFEPSTMRFFRSRVSEQVYPCVDGSGTLFVSSESGPGTLFVSSERGPDGVRAYSVKVSHLSGACGSDPALPGFRAFASRPHAHRAALRLSRVPGLIVPREE